MVGPANFETPRRRRSGCRVAAADLVRFGRVFPRRGSLCRFLGRRVVQEGDEQAAGVVLCRGQGGIAFNDVAQVVGRADIGIMPVPPTFSVGRGR